MQDEKASAQMGVGGEQGYRMEEDVTFQSRGGLRKELMKEEQLSLKIKRQAFLCILDKQDFFFGL